MLNGLQVIKPEPVLAPIFFYTRRLSKISNSRAGGHVFKSGLQLALKLDMWQQLNIENIFQYSITIMELA